MARVFAATPAHSANFECRWQLSTVHINATREGPQFIFAAALITTSLGPHIEWMGKVPIDAHVEHKVRPKWLLNGREKKNVALITKHYERTQHLCETKDTLRVHDKFNNWFSTFSSGSFCSNQLHDFIRHYGSSCMRDKHVHSAMIYSIKYAFVRYN